MGKACGRTRTVEPPDPTLITFMKPIAAFSGSHLRNFTALSLHPVSHNLDWHDVHALFCLCGGNPFDANCRTVETVGADLIVQTTHGRTGLERVLFGSTAERVVPHSPCPVLTAREINKIPQ